MSEKRSQSVLLGAAGILAVIGGSELLNPKFCKDDVYRKEANCSSSTSSRFSSGGGNWGGSQSSTARGGFGSSGHSFFGGS
jgi:hypothetical protein